MRQSVIAILAVSILLSGCAGGPQLPKGPEGFDSSLYGWNITATKLGILSSPDEISHELDLIVSKGYKRQIRIIVPYWSASTIERYWLPVIRAKGFKALVILSQGREEVMGHEVEALAWAQHVVTTWRDVLIGVQPANEPWVTHWPIDSYLAWHRAVTPIIRAAGLPVVTGDYGWGTGDDNHHAYYKGLDWQAEVDIISLHVTGDFNERNMQRLKTRLPAGKPVWITEGDWSQREILGVSESYIYTCDGDPDPKLNWCPKLEVNP